VPPPPIAAGPVYQPGIKYKTLAPNPAGTTQGGEVDGVGVLVFVTLIEGVTVGVLVLLGVIVGVFVGVSEGIGPFGHACPWEQAFSAVTSKPESATN